MERNKRYSIFVQKGGETPNEFKHPVEVGTLKEVHEKKKEIVKNYGKQGLKFTLYKRDNDGPNGDIVE